MVDPRFVEIVHKGWTTCYGSEVIEQLIRNAINRPEDCRQISWDCLVRYEPAVVQGDWATAACYGLWENVPQRDKCQAVLNRILQPIPPQTPLKDYL